MEPSAARDLISHSTLASGDGQVWADLGCGDGTFTRALASLLPDGSTIHAMDLDRSALERLGPTLNGDAVSPSKHVHLYPHVGDFTCAPWPFEGLDGILMANALHYVDDQAAFIQACVARMRRRRFLLVEYDTDRANTWVPHPIGKSRARELFAAAGLRRCTPLGTAPSIYRNAEIYALLAERREGVQ